MFRRIHFVPETLRTSPLGSLIPARELETVDRFGTQIRLAAGRHAMVENQVGRECMLVIDGAFRVVRDGRPVADLGRGDFMGEIALLENQPRNATVTATEDSVVYAFGRGEFSSLLRECPVLAAHIRSAAEARTTTTVAA